jgi:hypothetical protein
MKLYFTSLLHNPAGFGTLLSAYSSNWEDRFERETNEKKSIGGKGAADH